MTGSAISTKRKRLASMRQRVADRRLLYKRKAFVAGYLLKARLKRYRSDIVIGTRLRPVTIMFVPDTPFFVYTAWKMARLARLTVVPCSAGAADIVMYFKDETVSVNDPSYVASWYTLNAGCTNIAKDHVAMIFAQVFGYDLSIDPLTYRGRAVEKSKANCRHDGRIVELPIDRPDPDMEYQKLVDTTQGDQVVDIRTSIIGGRIPSVVLMTRPAATPFANIATTVTPIAPEDAFTPVEQTLILKFCPRDRAGPGRAGHPARQRRWPPLHRGRQQDQRQPLHQAELRYGLPGPHAHEPRLQGRIRKTTGREGERKAARRHQSRAP